jgi:type II secretory pathway pseudopilin PulG
MRRARTPFARSLSRSHQRANTTRPGAALVIALICLLLVGILATTLVRSAVLQHDQVTQEEWQIQAESLAASALERAAAQLAADPDYAGETWLPVSAAGAPLGRVLIEIAADDSAQPRLQTIRVMTDVPDASHRRARVSRKVSISPADSTALTPD